MIETTTNSKIYVELDENRFEIKSGNKENLSNPILVDCNSPDKTYKLKTDFQNYTDKDQWEIDFQKEQETITEKNNSEAREFLLNTDWMIIRHMDQLALGITTSLSTQEYQNLLSARQAKRTAVI